jgi:hypothetical protein
MDQSVSRGSSFDLSQARQISLLKITIAMLELPQCRFWRTRVEDIADFVKAIHVKLANKRGYVCMFEILCQYFGKLI